MPAGVVTGQSLFGGVHLEAVCQLVRAAPRGGVPAVDSSGVMPRRSRAMWRRKCSGNRRSSRQIRTRVGCPARLCAATVPSGPQTGCAPGSALGRLALAGHLGRRGRWHRRTGPAPSLYLVWGSVAVGRLSRRGDHGATRTSRPTATLSHTSGALPGATSAMSRESAFGMPGSGQDEACGGTG
jgi:hypothetical protein